MKPSGKHPAGCTCMGCKMSTKAAEKMKTPKKGK